MKAPPAPPGAFCCFASGRLALVDVLVHTGGAEPGMALGLLFMWRAKKADQCVPPVCVQGV